MIVLPFDCAGNSALKHQRQSRLGSPVKLGCGMGTRPAHPILGCCLERQRLAHLLRHHVLGVPVRPILIALAAVALFVLAVCF
jgi:hypothetical protein